ncbi:aldehyde dehydrogenase family protein [Mycobacterium sp. AZCC_0083]|uniref:aldehyde dehydrogenase family protein n=1 Tax=Mycobacterium sp. AZCC_0083 TaxID=2735882 RepID=UPI0016131D1C|nr:aldehyde dehydrogenase family protein [Mycobacterium sp. AZCC_0083]MBB5165494.1 acyl-CoA reductase-like NAD-dependent aldehyde dehydrogenase [Mycobacterium sp. AZCC_0083]
MTFRMLIDGQLRDGAATLAVINPATGRVFESCARADRAQVDEAIAAAKRSWVEWRGLDQSARGACLTALADLVTQRADDLARLLTQEQGKPLAQARAEINSGLARLRFFAEQHLAPVVLRDTDHELIVEYRRPLGVVAAITPWNFPFSLLIGKVAPALASGNTMVAKPAPTTPLTTCLLGELAAEALPPGVLNIVVDDNDLGNYLTSHPDVAKVGFTGSTATGSKVMASAAPTLKRLTLELGGNDAALVLPDADVPTVAGKVFAGAMLNAGQVCLATKRVYVPRAVYEPFCDEIAKLAMAAVVGDGMDETTQIGPVQNRTQFEKVLAMIDGARRDGEVIAGGTPLQSDGYFIAPTIVTCVDDDDEIVREEQFGPVLPILAYDSIDDAVARINDSRYGLGATVWGADQERATAVAARIVAGTVWVNRLIDLPPDIPFGGAKQSGIGRENGIEGMKEYTQVQIVSVSKTCA